MEVIEMPTLQIKIPEELYNSLKALGYQDQDIEREFLEDVVLQLYSKHVISMGKAASIIGLSIQAFREVLLKTFTCGIPDKRCV